MAINKPVLVSGRLKSVTSCDILNRKSYPRKRLGSLISWVILEDLQFPRERPSDVGPKADILHRFVVGKVLYFLALQLVRPC